MGPTKGGSVRHRPACLVHLRRDVSAAGAVAVPRRRGAPGAPRPRIAWLAVRGRGPRRFRGRDPAYDLERGARLPGVWAADELLGGSCAPTPVTPGKNV